MTSQLTKMLEDYSTDLVIGRSLLLRVETLTQLLEDGRVAVDALVQTSVFLVFAIKVLLVALTYSRVGDRLVIAANTHDN